MICHVRTKMGAYGATKTVYAPKPPSVQLSAIPTVGKLAKRILDTLGAFLLLAILSPVFVFVAGLVRSDGGTILYRHERVGQGGRLFRCLKFRTMSPDAESQLDGLLCADPEKAAEWKRFQKIQNDPRVTVLGRWLRKTSLDELPQLWNVLCGDMSLVGPRPILPTQVRLYGVGYRNYIRVRPGLTGPWQVGGRNRVPFRQRVVLETAYIRKWDFLIDILILIKTVPALLRTGEAK